MAQIAICMTSCTSARLGVPSAHYPGLVDQAFRALAAARQGVPCRARCGSYFGLQGHQPADGERRGATGKYLRP